MGVLGRTDAKAAATEASVVGLKATEADTCGRAAWMRKPHQSATSVRAASDLSGFTGMPRSEQISERRQGREEARNASSA